jgi:Pyruvate/2-oxoacid:ferredoxin oxidoreductase gamma subunit
MVTSRSSTKIPISKSSYPKLSRTTKADSLFILTQEALKSSQKRRKNTNTGKRLRKTSQDKIRSKEKRKSKRERKKRDKKKILRSK